MSEIICVDSLTLAFPNFLVEVGVCLNEGVFGDDHGRNRIENRLIAGALANLAETFVGTPVADGHRIFDDHRNPVVRHAASGLDNAARDDEECETVHVGVLRGGRHGLELQVG